MTDDVRDFLAHAKATAKVISLDELRAQRGELPSADSGASDAWSFAALRGRFVELSARGASATLTAAIGLVVEAQSQAEPVAWIAGPSGSFYPPDVADSGVDLAALVVVRVPEPVVASAPVRRRSRPFDSPGSAGARSDAERRGVWIERPELIAAERLLRSGAFGLVVLDLVGSPAEISMAHQGRLVTLAQAHDAAIVCLTEKADDASSIGSLVSLRAEALRSGAIGSRGARDPFEVRLRVLKDKRRGPGWTRAFKARGPAGT